MIVRGGPNVVLSAKYPSTPHWPWSPGIGRDEDVHSNPRRFVGESVVITEKLDGGNTLLHAGKVYARSVSAPSDDKWMAMIKKHHAWKVTEPHVYLYGEDIYGVHSITYAPVAEHETFHAFALRDSDGAFAAFAEVEAFARRRKIPVVPVLFRGYFRSVAEICAFMTRAHGEPSVLGGEREGVVLRVARGFPTAQFSDNVCKSVRAGHVQTDEHWTRNWRPCGIASRDAERKGGGSEQGIRGAIQPTGTVHHTIRRTGRVPRPAGYGSVRYLSEPDEASRQLPRRRPAA